MSVVAVFGSSETARGEELYETAAELGRELAGAGFAVLTGAYGGVMEGASRGAREAGGRTIGVACDAFRSRAPNPFLDEIVGSEDLFVRTRELIGRAAGFVVLAGRSGTLAELAFLWALDRAGCLGPKPVLLLGDLWRELLPALDEAGMLEPRQRELTHLVARPDEAAVTLLRLLDPRRTDP